MRINEEYFIQEVTLKMSNHLVFEYFHLFQVLYLFYSKTAKVEKYKFTIRMQLSSISLLSSVVRL